MFQTSKFKMIVFYEIKYLDISQTVDIRNSFIYNNFSYFGQIFYADSAEGDGKKRLDDDEDEELEMLCGNF